MSSWIAVITLVLVILLLNIGYTYPRIRRAYRLAHNSKVHTGRFRIGSTSNKPLSLLILGDSGITGQGISDFVDSAGGRFACMLGKNYYVEYLNQAGMGKWIGDIDHEQISGHWDLAILALGSNDLLHDGDFANFKRTLTDLLQKLAQHSDRLIVAGPGDLSKSKIFPWWYRILLHKREIKYANTIGKATGKVGGHYSNPIATPEIFQRLNHDGLHLGLHGNHLLALALWQKWLEWDGSYRDDEGGFTEEELRKIRVRV